MKAVRGNNPGTKFDLKDRADTNPKMTAHSKYDLFAALLFLFHVHAILTFDQAPRFDVLRLTLKHYAIGSS